MNSLFNEATTEGATKRRSLEGTAQLTTQAMQLCNDIITKVNDDISNGNLLSYKELLAESKASPEALDKLINETDVLVTADVEWLKDLDERTIDGMLKSQQSKRSRLKGKTMTRENYTSMLTAALAEQLIRKAFNKTKMSVRRSAGPLVITEDLLAHYANDQVDLRRELRNIQSKKSIAKAKDDFSEESEYWQSLLVAEEALKSVRIEGAVTQGKVIEVDTTKHKLMECFDNLPQDLNDYTKKQLVEVLEYIRGLTTTTITEEASDTEVAEDAEN